MVCGYGVLSEHNDSLLEVETNEAIQFTLGSSGAGNHLGVGAHYKVQEGNFI